VTIPIRIQRLLDDRVLETIQASDADVAALWEKAVRSGQDSRNVQNSVGNQYVLGYQAMATRIRWENPCGAARWQHLPSWER
jgi:hypothetical protein